MDLILMGETMINTMVPLAPFPPRHALHVKVLREVVVLMRSAAHAVYTAGPPVQRYRRSPGSGNLGMKRSWGNDSGKMMEHV